MQTSDTKLKRAGAALDWADTLDILPRDRFDRLAKIFTLSGYGVLDAIIMAHDTLNGPPVESPSFHRDKEGE